MTRIAVGAFLHETNTFAPTKATYDDFVHGGGWPSMAHGADVLKVMRNINVGRKSSGVRDSPNCVVSQRSGAIVAARTK